MAWKGRIRKLTYYRDFALLFRAFFISLKISFSPNRFLIPLANPKRKGKSEAREKIFRYAHLILYLRKLVGFRDTCLISSLLLCNLLRQSGIGAQVNFGARKDGRKMAGHCWVSIDNEGSPVDWQTIFKYPSSQNSKTTNSNTRATVADNYSEANTSGKDELVVYSQESL